jgi:hypothetical protein
VQSWDARVEVVPSGVAAPGTPVEVWARYTESWARGFEVAAWTPDGYRVRRRMDGVELPVVIPQDDVRVEHKHR